MDEGRKVAGALKNVWRRRKITTEEKMGTYNGKIVPSVLCGSETWEINAGLRRMLDVF